MSDCRIIYPFYPPVDYVKTHWSIQIRWSVTSPAIDWLNGTNTIPQKRYVYPMLVCCCQKYTTLTHHRSDSRLLGWHSKLTNYSGWSFHCFPNGTSQQVFQSPSVCTKTQDRQRLLCYFIIDPSVATLAQCQPNKESTPCASCRSVNDPEIIVFFLTVHVQKKTINHSILNYQGLRKRWLDIDINREHI